MRLRHAATLGLVGWYLLVPLTKDGRFDGSAPLTNWQVLKSFGSSSDCENGRRAILRGTDQPSDLLHVYAHYGAIRSRCIASDDQRLKEN